MTQRDVQSHKSIVILAEEGPTGKRFERLIREVLEFSGASGGDNAVPSGTPQSAQAIITTAKALSASGITAGILRDFSLGFVFAGDDALAYERAVELTGGYAHSSTGDEEVRVRVSEQAGVSGPFAGLAFGPVSASRVIWLKEAAGVESIVNDETDGIGAGRVGNFWFCGASGPADLAEPHPYRRLDIKRCFFELVPLLLFIQHAFGEFPRRSPGSCACLTVDDPLLRERYGRFRLREVLSMVEQRALALNLGFIPWNYQRSDQKLARFIRSQSRFSICVHGCDHTKYEFRERNIESLNWRAATATERMRAHEEIYGTPFERVMIFPEGAFSGEAAAALQMNNYVAAVNTHICADEDTSGPTVRDVLEPSVMKYEGFPIVARRYFDHGLENIALDILLGKPCLIATHHHEYGDETESLLTRIEKIAAMKPNLVWRPLGEVVRALYKTDRDNNVWLFANEISYRNHEQAAVHLQFRKREGSAAPTVTVNGRPSEIQFENGESVINQDVSPGETVKLRYNYCPGAVRRPPGGWAYREKVRWRRYVSEVRDHVLNRAPTIRLVN